MRRAAGPARRGAVRGAGIAVKNRSMSSGDNNSSGDTGNKILDPGSLVAMALCGQREAGERTGQLGCAELPGDDQVVNVDVDSPAEDVVVLGVVASVLDALVVED